MTRSQAVVLDRQRPLCEGVADGLDEGLGHEGLDQKTVEMCRRGQRAVERRQAGEQQHRRVGVLFFQPARQVHPGVVSKLVVHHHGGRMLQAVQGQCLGRVRSHEHLDARPFEHRRQTVSGGLVVVDDKDRVL